MFLYNKNMPFFSYESICSLDELDEKSNHTKISKFWNFRRKDYKINDSFFKPVNKKVIFNKFKMFNFRHKLHVQEIIL